MEAMKLIEALNRHGWYDTFTGGQMTPLGPFVVQNNRSENGYLHVEDDYAHWGNFEQATIFHSFNTLINFVIDAVYRRPDNWVHNKRSWTLLEVTTEPPIVPKYRLTGRTL